MKQIETPAGQSGAWRSAASQGLAVHYRVFGSGRPLLVLGGGPGDNSDRYLGLCELLAGDYACVLVEQRGVGRSSPEPKDASTVTIDLTLSDLEAIRQALGLERWAVLGFSYGGFLASVYAQRRPAAVSALVLVDSSGLGGPDNPGFGDNIVSRMTAQDRQLMDWWQDPARLKADYGHAVAEIVRAMMPGYFFDRAKSLAVSQAINDASFDLAAGGLIDADIKRQNLDLAAEPKAWDGPALILHGRQDPLGEGVPLALARHYGQATLRFIEQAGHYAYAEQPDQVRAAIAEFLGAFPD